MPLDPSIREMLDLFAADPDTKSVQHLTPAEVRTRLRQTARAFGGRPAAVGAVEDRTIPGPTSDLPLRIYTPTGDAGARPGPHPGIIYFHGGGWVAGDLDSHDTVCRNLCHDSAAVVVAVDYRLAPEHPFPAAVLDAIAATAHIAANAAALGLDLTGSRSRATPAGGNLAAIVALHARDHGPTLRLQLLIYPVTDTSTDTPSYTENARGYGLETDGMRWFFGHYAPDPDNPRAAPLRAPDLAGLPPALILTAGYDPLRDDGRAYAAALERAGNQVELRDYETLVHGFATMTGVSEVSRGAMRDAARTVSEILRRWASS